MEGIMLCARQQNYDGKGQLVGNLDKEGRVHLEGKEKGEGGPTLIASFAIGDSKELRGISNAFSRRMPIRPQDAYSCKTLNPSVPSNMNCAWAC